MKKLFVDEIGFRSRPYVVHSGDILPIGTPYSDISFPSSYIVSIIALLTVLIYFISEMWLFALVFVLMMGFSRTYNGMYYPSDVLIGSFLGILCGMGGLVLTKKIFRI